MGVLTEDMTRLRQQVSAWRDARMALRKDLARGLKDLRKSVSRMRSGFRKAQTAMAEQTQTAGGAFVSDVRASVLALQQNVAGMRGEFSADIEAARQAWLGGAADPSPGPPPHAGRSQAHSPPRRARKGTGRGRRKS